QRRCAHHGINGCYRPWESHKNPPRKVLRRFLLLLSCWSDVHSILSLLRRHPSHRLKCIAGSWVAQPQQFPEPPTFASTRLQRALGNTVRRHAHPQDESAALQNRCRAREKFHFLVGSRSACLRLPWQRFPVDPDILPSPSEYYSALLLRAE